MGEDTDFIWRMILENGVGVRCDTVTGQRRHHDRGHLYLDSDMTEITDRSIKMHRSLGDWIERRPHHRAQVNLRGLFAMNNYYHKIGRDEGAEIWSRIAGLFDHLSPGTPRANAILRACANPTIGPLYRALFRVYRFPRNMLERLKRLGRK